MFDLEIVNTCLINKKKEEKTVVTLIAIKVTTRINVTCVFVCVNVCACVCMSFIIDFHYFENVHIEDENDLESHNKKYLLFSVKIKKNKQTKKWGKEEHMRGIERD